MSLSRTFQGSVAGLAVATALCLWIGPHARALAADASAPAPLATGLPRLTATRASAVSRTRMAQVRKAMAAGGATVLSDAFTESASAPNLWRAVGDACLTAGTSGTPTTSIPACGANAPVDAAGSGALQLTKSATSQGGMIVANSAISTANGLQITFTDYSFNGSGSGGDGITLLLADASKAMPTALGGLGGSLGYANSTSGGATGVANAYLGVGLDEYGNFSNPTEGRVGGPGRISETLSVRGAATIKYAYLGGAKNASGTAASLPFAWDAPTATTRPASAPTITVTLPANGLLTVAVDRHDGNGSVGYVSQQIVGAAGEPAVPAAVYVGFTSSTGGASSNRHQIGKLTVSDLSASTTFAPTQIPNLTAWFDASNPNSVPAVAGPVTTWNDLSGNGNAVAQANAAAQPSFVSAGINGMGSLNFSGAQYLVGTNSAFSNTLFNASTVFVVSNQTNATQQSSLVWSGQYYGNPRWSLRLSEAGVSHFDFNNANGDGRLIGSDQPTGPAIWTAAGSFSAQTQFLRKNGNDVASSPGPVATAAGSFPLAIGAMVQGTQVSYQYTGQLGEVLSFSRLLSQMEQDQVEGYLACKWGLQSRLPANHPYHGTCPQGGSPAPVATPPPSAGSLIDPPQLVSSNGSLTFNVVAQQNATTGNPQLLYNGSTTPPTLRLLPGDTLYVNLTNNLPTPPSGANYLNDTNLHYHGLHVNPNAPGDDSIDMLAMPGQALHYTIAIPTNHPTGLYWYHSHAHGEAERQNLSGMSGALIIDGIASYAPQVANMPERVLVVRDVLPAGQQLPDADVRQIRAMEWAMQHGHRTRVPGAPAMHAMAHATGAMAMSMDSRVTGRTNAQTRNPYVKVDPHYRRLAAAQTDTHCTSAETAVKNWTVNGQTNPTIGLRRGEQQFWRLVNAGSDSYLDLQYDGGVMTILAIDGVPIGNGTGTPNALQVSHYVVPPASRVEFTVTGSPASNLYLRTNCFDAGASGPAMPAAILATINHSLSTTDAKHRAARKLRYNVTGRRHTAAMVRAQAVSATQTIYYSDQNTINGQSYDPAGPAQFYAQSGTVQEWTVVNNSSQVHTFHIHQIHMLVEAINGVAQSQEYLIDNVNVPAASASGPGTVKVLLDFSDPLIVGTFLLHCHILSHEDAGMMSKIRVGTAPPMTVSSSQVTFASASSPAQTVTVSGGQTPYSVSGCSGVASASVSGSTLTLHPTAAGSCVVTVSDTTGLVVSVSVTVNAAASPVSVSPNTLSFTSPTAASQTSTISGGTAPYTVAGCSGVASTSVGASTVTVMPAAAGSCTLTVSDSASNTATLAVSVNAAASGSPQDNLTFHQNAMRQGWYSAETKLTTSNVATSSFGLLGTLVAPSGSPAFGKVYAQPLFVTNQTVADGSTHNLVIVATATDQIYAFDDATDTVVWHRSFTNPGAGITQQLSTDAGCSDVNPDVGITGTPVIDRSRNLLYVVVPTKENGTFHQRLHAISLTNGNDGPTPVDVTATVALASGGTASINPETNFSRAALLEANGNVYVSLGSHCDYNSSTTHGWVLSYNPSTLAVTGNALNVTGLNTGNTYFLGAIWMSGFGPAADAQGNIYVATGNGPWDGHNDFSMSVIRVPGTLDLSKATYFTPNGESTDSGADADLGSGGVLLLPDVGGSYPHLAVQGGKCGAGSPGTTGCQKYLLNRDSLGGKQSGDVGALWHADTGGGIWGGPAAFQDSSGTNYIVYGTGSPLSTYKLNLGPASLSVQSSASVGCLECRNSGSQPIVSSNGTTAGTAIVWALKTPGNSGGNITLYAFDALNMSHTLFSGTAGTWTPGSGAPYIGGALISPTVANGRVYVPTGSGVAVFGLH